MYNSTTLRLNRYKTDVNRIIVSAVKIKKIVNLYILWVSSMIVGLSKTFKHQFMMDYSGPP